MKCACGSNMGYAKGIGWYCLRGFGCTAPLRAKNPDALLAKPGHVCECGKDRRIAELEAEVAALRARAANMDTWDLRLFPECGHFAPNSSIGSDRKCPVCAEVAELRKDRARLDWLDSGGVWKMEKRYDTSRGAHWPVFFKPWYGWREYRGDTARESIDQAMKACIL